jgi:putative phosphoribosyl transferase
MEESSEVLVEAGPARLPGRLELPGGSRAVVVFAHGSGSSRLSPRNVAVAGSLGARGLGTLLFDLLTDEESGRRELVFDIPFLGSRLAGAAAWLMPNAAGLPVGYFGASTGAGAALWAATEPGAPEPFAIVSRGGRPDLAGERLGVVRAPTLLIVGGNDLVVLDLNREAAAQLRCENEVAVVPRATHLFEEAGTLEDVARLAGDWFVRHLPGIDATS